MRTNVSPSLTMSWLIENTFKCHTSPVWRSPKDYVAANFVPLMKKGWPPLALTNVNSCNGIFGKKK